MGVRSRESGVRDQLPSPITHHPSPTSGIAAAFARAKAEGRIALLPFVTGGYPTMAQCERLIPALVEGGADVIEIGIPFSDPLADGATVQRTSQVALANGTTLADCFALVRRVRAAGISAPLVFMGYTNPFYQYGIERLANDAAGAGVDGFIVPDLPVEESDEWVEAFQRHGRDLIFLVAPTSTDARIAEVAKRASGFVYCVSLTGVTGARDTLAEGLAAYMARVRAQTDLPLAIGFGISRPEHVAEIRPFTDGVLVASALINRLDTLAEDEQPAAARDFLHWLVGED
ncbi:MAG: tryptophan synthase subunit alpha [Thermomicrobiales bacterium]